MLVSLLLNLPLAQAKPPGGGGGGPPQEPVPIALVQEDYYFRVAGENTCLGEDDELEWLATGSLDPGDSFTFTPLYPGCNGHPAAVSVVATWGNGSLTLSSEVPDSDYSSWDAEQAGLPVEAPELAQSAQLCMFPAFSGDGRNYTITLTNHSSEAVHDIQLHGRHENDWPIFYYPRCVNADADLDGWNDSLEHTMGILVYPNGYIDGIFQPYILWGSNYLRDRAITGQPINEIDSLPPDFNDDGTVDQLDFAILGNWMDQGNGIPLEEISPNPGPQWFHENTLPWRRFDLDGDGYVGVEDEHILQQAMELDVPMTLDTISPTARITEPQGGDSVARGEYLLIRSHVWDNAALARVDYLVDGRVVCSVTDPTPAFGFSSPFYYCWWDVPRRAKPHEIVVRAYDLAGNSTTSAIVSVETH